MQNGENKLSSWRLKRNLFRRMIAQPKIKAVQFKTNSSITSSKNQLSTTLVTFLLEKLTTQKLKVRKQLMNVMMKHISWKISQKITLVLHLQKTWNQFDQIQGRNFLEQK